MDITAPIPYSVVGAMPLHFVQVWELCLKKKNLIWVKKPKPTQKVVREKLNSCTYIPIHVIPRHNLGPSVHVILQFSKIK